MNTTEINWGYNCLTQGIYHGRPEKIWNLPLIQSMYMFTPGQMQQLVVDRIYNDAMQFVEHGDGNRPTQEWADKVKKLASKNVLPVYEKKTSEILRYYMDSTGFKQDLDFAIERNKMDKLNPSYEPLHDHDTINLLCRMVGVSASIKASKQHSQK